MEHSSSGSEPRLGEPASSGRQLKSLTLVLSAAPVLSGLAAGITAKNTEVVSHGFDLDAVITLSGVLACYCAYSAIVSRDYHKAGVVSILLGLWLASNGFIEAYDFHFGIFLVILLSFTATISDESVEILGKTLIRTWPIWSARGLYGLALSTLYVLHEFFGSEGYQLRGWFVKLGFTIALAALVAISIQPLQVYMKVVVAICACLMIRVAKDKKYDVTLGCMLLFWVGTLNGSFLKGNAYLCTGLIFSNFGFRLSRELMSPDCSSSLVSLAVVCAIVSDFCLAPTAFNQTILPMRSAYFRFLVVSILAGGYYQFCQKILHLETLNNIVPYLLSAAILMRLMRDEYLIASLTVCFVVLATDVFLKVTGDVSRRFSWFLLLIVGISHVLCAPQHVSYWFEMSSDQQRYICNRMLLELDGAWERPISGYMTMSNRHAYRAHESLACQTTFPTDTEWWNQHDITVLGDSVSRFVFYNLVSQTVDPSYGYPTAPYHGDITISSRMRFRWAPFANNLANATKNHVDSDLIIVGVGLWDKLWRRDIDMFSQDLERFITFFNKQPRALPVLMFLEPTPTVDKNLVGEDKKKYLIEATAPSWRAVLRNTMKKYKGRAVYLPTVAVTKERVSHDGVHYDRHTYSAIAKTILRTVTYMNIDN